MTSGIEIASAVGGHQNAPGDMQRNPPQKSGDSVAALQHGIGAAHASMGGRQTESEAREMLAKLLGVFSGDGELSEHSYEWIPPSKIPQEFGVLLAHEEHLTKVLEDRHGQVNVEVMRVLHDAGGGEGTYSRSISLRGPGGGAIARAILHADLNRLPAVVREGVIEQGIPFGKLLMDHVKERCVRLEALWRVELGVHGFGVGGGGGHGSFVYGRTVTIDCDGLAAAEVLEVLPVMGKPHAAGGEETQETAN